MPPNRFCRVELRTTDPSAAQAFYANVLGPQVWGSEVIVSLLPERAAARGAPAHWLGHLGVSDVEATSARLLALGGERLGPMPRGADGPLHAVLRDPFGAVLALRPETAAPSPAVVAWYSLHAPDHERAFAVYADLFGWTAFGHIDLGPENGSHQLFGWDDSGHPAGSISNAARLPHIHPHWMFCFRVEDIEGAFAAVAKHGGKGVGSMETPSGDVIAPCEDAQGAAFALYQPVSRARRGVAR